MKQKLGLKAKVALMARAKEDDSKDIKSQVDRTRGILISYMIVSMEFDDEFFITLTSICFGIYST